MDRLQLPHAKLLYFVSELWKQKELNDTEKLMIKGTIASFFFGKILLKKRLGIFKRIAEEKSIIYLKSTSREDFNDKK